MIYNGNTFSEIFAPTSVTTMVVASAGVGSTVVASGIPIANTIGIIGSSTAFSTGLSFLSGYQSDYEVSFGAASYNVKEDEWGNLGNKVMPYHEYYPDGRIMTEGKTIGIFPNGYFGEIKVFYPDGSLLRELICDETIPQFRIGTWSWWD